MTEHLDEKVAWALVRKYLSALPGYPVHDDGQRCLAMYLSKYAVGVYHAESIVQFFRSRCPTPQDLHDVAYNATLRAKYEKDGGV